jgi:hypothetical protein
MKMILGLMAIAMVAFRVEADDVLPPTTSEPVMEISGEDKETIELYAIKNAKSESPRGLKRLSIGESEYTIKLIGVRSLPPDNPGWKTPWRSIVEAARIGAPIPGLITSSYLDPAYVSQNQDKSMSNLWILADVTARDSTVPLHLNMIRCMQFSSDYGPGHTNGTLENGYDLVGGNYAYSPESPGVDYSGKILDSGTGYTQAKRILVGLSSIYYNVTPTYPQQMVNDWVINNRLGLLTTLQIVDFHNKTNVLGQKQIVFVNPGPHGAPVPPFTVSITRQGANNHIRYNGAPAGKQVALQMMGNSWSSLTAVPVLEANGIAGTFIIPSSLRYGSYRAMAQ